MTTDKHTKSDDCRYHDKCSVPRSIPAGRVLAHNHIAHGPSTPNGVRGFRCWTWPADKVPSNEELCDDAS